ncbi:MAG: ABC transporter permease [Clostridia bacterium]|nr:ABC transporter permease [Clostridia bacterium]
MLKYIIKRLALAILILLGVSLIIYVLVRMMPVNFVQDKINAMNQGGAQIPQETVDAMYELYGLKDGSFLGVLRGYVSWLGALLQGDLGTSFLYGHPVLDEIVENMGTSFAIAFIAIIFEYMIAIPLGVTAATHQYSMRDYVVTILVMIGISLPSFFFGRFLQNILAVQLGWFPIAGNLSGSGGTGITQFFDRIHHMILPIMVMVLLSIGGAMRYMRTNMLEVLNSDYIRTARAKGLSESKVIYKHAFRNTMIPIVTMMAGILPTLFSGAMITEQVFDLQGIGNIALKAMQAGDIPFIMGYNMFIAMLSVIGVLLSDLMYAVVDPRVKLY